MTAARLIANLLWLPLIAAASYLIHHHAALGWPASVGLGALAGSAATLAVALVLSFVLDR